MTPQELKNSILQMAIQGKLVEQRAEEGTAQKLLVELQCHPVNEETPFDIPDSWGWCHLEDIVTKPIKRGKSPTYIKESNTLVFAQKCNTKAGYIDLSLCLYLDESKLSKYPSDEFMQDADIVINSTGNGTLGRVGIYHDSDNPNHLPIVPDSHVTIIRVNERLSYKYVYYGLKYYQPFMEKLGSGSTNQTELSASIVKAFLFPIPPLAEQHRIVAKIESLLPLIDRYEKAWTRLEEFNKRFPGDMQKSLLQMAIQGKLVEQRPEEGTGEELYRQIQQEKARLVREGRIKKEKPLPEIAEDEVPFEVPETWKWVRLGSILTKLTDGTHSTPKYVESGIPFLSVKDMSSGVLHFENCKYITKAEHEELYSRCNPEYGDLLLTKVGTTGIPVIVDTEMQFSLFVSVALLKFNHSLVNNRFLQLLINTPLVQEQAAENTRGVGNKNWVMRDIANTLIVLPPLAEQHRIVARLEELLPLCERLK